MLTVPRNLADRPVVVSIFDHRSIGVKPAPSDGRPWPRTVMYVAGRRAGSESEAGPVRPLLHSVDRGQHLVAGAGEDRAPAGDAQPGQQRLAGLGHGDLGLWVLLGDDLAQRAEPVDQPQLLRLGPGPHLAGEQLRVVGQLVAAAALHPI